MFEFKEDKLNLVILDKFTSTSGKYLCFLGEHFNGTERCIDVGVFNNFKRELIRRHYQLEWEAKEFYEHFKEDMRGSGEYESDEPSGFESFSPN